jgi:hypothetical protein
LDRLEPPPDVTARNRDVADWHDATARLSATCNKIKDAATRHKDAAKWALIRKQDHEELPSISIDKDGERVTYTKYEFPHPKIEDENALREWAVNDDGEALFEPQVRLRKDQLAAAVRRHIADGEPLPPGLSVFLETKISRSVKKL